MTQVTVFTGFLGAGKTTIILEIIKQLPKEYKTVLLKNEFGDVKVDSALAQVGQVMVQEMMNGCLCCVLVGQMKQALLDIKKQYNPARIIIETSGSAFPAPIAWQIRELQQDGFVLDSIITVVDCCNFVGYEDTSYTAKLQAQYTDLILLNKHNLRELDIVIDHVNELNTDTPKIKWNADNITFNMIFGIDTKLFSLPMNEPIIDDHDKEIEIICIKTGMVNGLEEFLNTLSKERIYRVKGIVLTKNGTVILNWAFERFQLTPFPDQNESKITVMGVDLYMERSKFEQFFGRDACS